MNVPCGRALGQPWLGNIPEHHEITWDMVCPALTVVAKEDKTALTLKDGAVPATGAEPLCSSQSRGRSGCDSESNSFGSWGQPNNGKSRGGLQSPGQEVGSKVQAPEGLRAGLESQRRAQAKQPGPQSEKLPEQELR